jgi:site-specific DNA recombinase
MIRERIMMKKNDVVRVAIYARVSTTEQAEDGFSIPAQIEVIREHCQREGKLVVKEYVDNGLSAKSIDNRPDLMRLLDDASKKIFDEVIVWKSSRLSRNTEDQLKMVRIFQKNNISFHSLTENFDASNPTGELIMGVLSVFNTYERKNTVQNVKLGMRQRAKQGKWNGGIVLGYDTVRVPGTDGTRLQINKDEAYVVQRIFNLYASGKGYKAIASQLNYDGFKTKKLNYFSTIGVRTILTNPVYIGKVRFVTHIGSEKKSPHEFIYDGEHEPIITEDLWNTVQSIFQSKNKMPTKNFNGSYPLVGLIKCPICGASMVSYRSKKKRKDGSYSIYHYYACGSWKYKGTAVCKSNLIRADYADKYIYDRLKEIVLKPQILQDIVENINRKKSNGISSIQEELDHISKNLDSIEKVRNKYFALFEKDIIDDRELANRLRKQDTKYKGLSKIKLDLEQKLRSNNNDAIPYEYVREVLTDLQYNLQKSLPKKQEKQLLHLFVEDIVLDSNRKIQNIKLNFNEQTHRHFLRSKAESTEESSDHEDSSHIFKKFKKDYPLFMVGFTPIYPKPPIHLLKQYYLHKLMRESH